MVSKIFINLPVKNLNKSVEFFTRLGFAFDPQFTDDKATCMIVSDSIFVMLLTEPFFQTFTKKQINDAKEATEVLLALNVESRTKVDDLVKKAIAAGGSVYMEPQDHGWMYSHSFADLDGHQWEVFYSDMSQLSQG